MPIHSPKLAALRLLEYFAERIAVKCAVGPLLLVMSEFMQDWRNRVGGCSDVELAEFITQIH
jgi:hypothetical protein